MMLMPMIETLNERKELVCVIGDLEIFICILSRKIGLYT